MLSQVEGWAREAGQILLNYYQKPDLKIMSKADESPVTEADYASNDLLLNRLQKFNIPIVTEESVPADFRASEFFICDPLDGTRYFIEGRKEFAVLISLIKDWRPHMGVIHFPALDITFTAEKGTGSYLNGERIFNSENRTELKAFSSGFHKREQAQDLIKKLNIKDIKEQESILKLGYMARGDVDLYPRFGRTYEWDTAAGQIVLEEAGCEMWDIRTLEPMEYCKENFENKGYLSFRKSLSDSIRDIFKDFKWSRKDSGPID